MGSSVNVCVKGCIVVAYLIDYALRFLCCCRIVEISKWFASTAGSEDWEITAYICLRHLSFIVLV